MRFRSGKEQSSQTVASYLVCSIPVAADWENAGQFRARFVGQHYEDASHVFVLARDAPACRHRRDQGFARPSRHERGDRDRL
jgi:hypothetical protein